MNLTQLKYFEAVCTFNSISKAAEYLHISQPSLSSAIKDLEQEFGLLLFTRHHKGVSPTAQGEILLKMGKDILGRINNAENIMQDLGKERKKLKLGVPPMIGSVILPKIYKQFLFQNPDLSIEIFEGGYADLTQKLQENYIDMAFLPHDTAFSPELSSVFLGKLEVICCAHKDNYLAKFSKVNPKTLKNVPVILFENSFFQTAKIKKWFQDQNINPNILLQTKQLSTVLKMISENLAVGFMFKEIIDKSFNIVPIPMENQININVSLVCKKNLRSIKSIEKFIKYMKTNISFDVDV